jgi:hypothetical protein
MCTIVGEKVLSILSAIKKYPRIELFADPVDPDLAPGYQEMIKTPMDISKIEKKAMDGEYSFSKGDKRFVRDMRLIWSNCKEYNLPDSDIVAWADELSYSCELMFSKAFGYDAPKKRAGRPSNAQREVREALNGSAKAVSEGALKKDDSSYISSTEEVHTKLEVIMAKLITCEFCVPELLNPMDEKYPDYKSRISQPMFLSTVQTRLQSGVYDTNPQGFIRDLKLACDNTKSYFPSESLIYQAADEMRQLAERKFRYQFTVAAQRAAIAAGVPLDQAKMISLSSAVKGGYQRATVSEIPKPTVSKSVVTPAATSLETEKPTFSESVVSRSYSTLKRLSKIEVRFINNIKFQNDTDIVERYQIEESSNSFPSQRSEIKTLRPVIVTQMKHIAAASVLQEVSSSEDDENGTSTAPLTI